VIDRWKLGDAFIVPAVDPQIVNRNLGAAGAQYIEKHLAKQETLLGLGGEYGFADSEHLSVVDPRKSLWLL